jgi:dolichol-phosphate mannosyltransferase
MQGVAIAIPTYNEVDNVQKLIPAIRQVQPSVRIFVIDDNSPDGTADAVRRMQSSILGLELITRPEKTGLAAAYLDAFEKVLRDDTVQCIVSMDGDLSHRPQDLGNLFAAMERADLVVGSRYVKGGSIENWNLWRRSLSRYGNVYARWVTGVPIRDLTSGFVLYRRGVLEKILNHRVMSRDYAFQIEMKYLAYKNGARIAETPITFCDRGEGVSKLERGVVWEGILRPWNLRLNR